MTTTSLEQEISRMESDLAVKKQALSERFQNGEIKEVPADKEILHEVIGQRIQSAEIAPVPNETVSGQPPPIAEPPSYLSPELKDTIQELINVAFNESSPDEAIKSALSSGNAALIDAFHDALVNEVYDYLIEQGKLKKI